ncbi:hypothetical protein FA13DRAFT_1715876 [Coprinellus micaceus]|uniref:Uncharacterized protein n=1 Tax=Coprinellus micaceus TaxID=71717 RepID=A0A4Y7SLB5_COPMI|nr:hypothetical protein FA13DRAFT_1715876 [Coprinellus micaceus]
MSEETSLFLKDVVRDLRTNGQDLRLILAYMERDIARLQKSLDAEVAKNAEFQAQIKASRKETQHLECRNEELEELLDLRTGDRSDICCAQLEISIDHMSPRSNEIPSGSSASYGPDLGRSGETHQRKRQRQHSPPSAPRRSSRKRKAPTRFNSVEIVPPSEVTLRSPEY